MHKLTHFELQQKRLTEQAAAELTGRLPVTVILEDIRSLYNVGAIFRTSDGARVEALYTSGYTPHPPRKEIEKTALGATRTVPHRHFETVAEAIQAARIAWHERDQQPAVAALELTTESRSVFNLTRADLPLILVVGNEVTGVSDEALTLCDLALEIPMLGAKHSLNVAVAYGIAVFECVRLHASE